MVVIEGLKETPKRCTYGGCPCYRDGDMSGPPACLIKEMLTHDPFNATPNLETCPLKKVSEC